MHYVMELHHAEKYESNEYNMNDSRVDWVVVNQNYEVEVAHQKAREYFAQNGTLSGFVVVRTGATDTPGNTKYIPEPEESYNIRV